MDLEVPLSDAVHAVPAIFRVDGAGLFLTNADDVLRSVATSGSGSAEFERAQIETGEGPCIDAFVTDSVISATDLEADDRYPHTGPLVANLGVRAVLALPVHLAGSPAGSLNCFARQPTNWTAADRDGLRRFASVLSGLLDAAIAAHLQGALAGQLQYALDYRVVIERAVGYLMAGRGLDEVQAFNVLRAASRSSRRKVADVAAEVLAGGALPGD